MLTLTTSRNRIFVCIPGISGTSQDCFRAYDALIDSVADALLAVSKEDPALLAYLETCTDRLAGYQRIAEHLAAVTTDKKWLRDCAASALCGFVFDALQPDFFAKLASLQEQQRLAKQVIAQCGYRVPAVITQTALPEGRKVFGFRFLSGAATGDLLHNADHTHSLVMDVVHPTEHTA